MQIRSGVLSITLKYCYQRGSTHYFQRPVPRDLAVILMTGDDVGKAKAEAALNPRARQNVILELGYFAGLIGRSRVCALYKDDVEIPSDILSIGYVKLDDAGHWKFELARELRAAGYQVDANSLLG